MKAIKLSVISAAVLLSTSAMANVVTDTGAAVVNVATTTGTALVDGTKTVFNTVINPGSVSAEVGSLGYGANIGWSLNEKTELQAGWNGGNITDLVGGDFKVNGLRYDLSTDLNNPYLAIQHRPAGNWFTVGTGIIVPNNEITAKLQKREKGENVSVGGVSYNLDAAEVEATIDHRNKLAPFATIGFRPNLNNNWGVFGEVGAAYMGKTQADVNVISGTVTTDGVAANSQFERAAASEIEDKDWSNWMPIVKVGATYRF